MSKPLTNEAFIIKAKKIHGNNYSYEHVQYVNWLSKVKIFCFSCNSFFEQSPKHHFRGNGCPKCCFIPFTKTKEKFIQEAVIKYGIDKFSYDKIIYKNCSTEIQIFCNDCKSFFSTTPNAHLRNGACPKCLYKDILIKKAQKKFGNKYSYDHLSYVDQKTEMRIFCNPCNNWFLQKPNKHLRFEGCKKCLSKKKTNQYISKAKLVHGEKYDYSSSVYSGIQKKINIFCLKCKSFFSQRADRHLKGYNCNNCSKGGSGIKITLQDFIKKSVEKHGNRYNYDLVVYKNSLTYVKITCNTCKKIFEQIPNAHWAGHGCPYQCSLQNKRGPKLSKRAEKFLLKVKRIHGNEYDFSVINYTKDRNEISVKNNICGHKFEILPKSFLELKQCRVCYEFSEQKDRYERFVTKARQIHGDDFDYSIGSYINYNTKFKVLHKICNKTFYLLPQNHIHYESGCPFCSGGSISKVSQKWLDYLGIPKDIGIYREVKIKIPNMKTHFIVDGFDPTTNTIYEFHGDYWHGNPNIYDPEDINKVNNKSFGKLFEETTKRSQKLRNAGYNLVSIWESKWYEIEKNLLLKQTA